MELSRPNIHRNDQASLEQQEENRSALEKALVRKLDARLLPILILMYILNYIDRNALPQARRQGLVEELGLVGSQYNTVLSLTFVGYILGQVPSNMIMSSIKRPSRYLCAAMVAWGILSGTSGATVNYGSIAACRFLLGFCEAPFFSGVAFLFSGWYTRKEIGKRLGIFFCGSMAAGAFGGLISAGIAAAFRNNAISSWRWLFIIEGSITVALALSIVFIIPDWPKTTPWLSKEEKALSVLRLQEDAGEDSDHGMTAFHALKLTVSDHRVWLCIVGQMAMQAVASLTNFLPSLVAQFGHDEVITLLLTAPPYVAAGLYSVLACIWSDSLSKRSPFIILPTIAAMTGIVITLSTNNASAQYAALFLMLPGTYGCFQINNAWMANIANRPSKKRGIALALNNGAGNSALVWTPFLYDKRMGPDYTLAWSINLGLLVVLLATTITLSLVLQKANSEISNTHAADISIGDDLRVRDSSVLWELAKSKAMGHGCEFEGNGRVRRRFDT